MPDVNAQDMANKVAATLATEDNAVSEQVGMLKSFIATTSHAKNISGIVQDCPTWSYRILLPSVLTKGTVPCVFRTNADTSCTVLCGESKIMEDSRWSARRMCAMMTKLSALRIVTHSLMKPFHYHQLQFEAALIPERINGLNESDACDSSYSSFTMVKS